MKKALIIALAALLAASSIYAETPLWLRDVKISPDGTTIAFCYKGDIYTVPACGGSAKRLTTQASYEQTPVWSPDSRSIAFASNRYGNFDVFVMPSEGGSATRLTFNSVKELPLSFTPDGKSILFSANIQSPAASAQFPRASLGQVYQVPVAGGKSVQILGTPAHAISCSPHGHFFLYQDTKGMEDTWRKHHISSVTRDIWRYDTRSHKHTNLTNRPGEDLDPVLDPDGKVVYLLSEPAVGDGHPAPEGWQTSINVYSFKLSDPSTYTQVTSFDTHPVRFLSLGGGTLCYTWDGEIYTQKIGGEPRKVAIDLVADGENLPQHLNITSGASYTEVSPDGKQVAFIVRGEVFVTSVDYKTTKRITDTPAAESEVRFSPDGRTLLYASERDGIRQLYLAKIRRAEDPNFPNATVIDEERIFPSATIDRFSPSFSPDGKKVAFIEDRTRLCVGDLATGKVTQVTDGSQWFDLGTPFVYEWSPDGKWFTLEFVPNGRDPYYNIGIVSAEGGEVKDITGSGYMSNSPGFTLDGKGIIFTSNRYGMRSHASWGSQEDVFLCFLTQDAYDRYRLSKEDYELLKEVEKKAKKSAPAGTAVELEGIEDRIVRLTPNSCNLGGAILSKDGETLYYTARFEGDFDLWKEDIRKRESKLVSKGCGPGFFEADSTGKKIFLFGKTMKMLEGDKLKPITYNAEMELDRAAEREYMFDYIQREEQQRFYCEDMHGVDWEKYCAAYRRFLPHINNNFDFAEMCSELLGELNVSHTGARFKPLNSGLKTASLGLLYDLSYPGAGLKVADVVKKGPFDKAGIEVKAGEIITHINGILLDNNTDPSLLLMGCEGKKTLVTIKDRGDFVVIPVSDSRMDDLLYQRWVEKRAEDVKRLSGGRLGYVHIQSMGDGSFRTIYNDLLGKYNKCEGIVIDQRYNGGGRLHEDIEVLFNSEKYLTQMIRGREVCDMPSRRWNKPSIMLQCECDYSNAHGTPWVYKTKKIGKLVGAPVPGTMTSVNWQELQDKSMVFGIPVTGYLTADGTYLENSQLEPDILVYNTPEGLTRGEDAQLEAAVKALLAEIDAAK